ncbi:alkaline phosphatase [Marivirga harenae]|uniref:alkaline phosphatase n=1 Tax=Marivirga harenae TaxID=2010992 RepID=UPI0026DEAF56|nr:alkaline phosphatase [Marivirga harenae]WKV13824.1 alkaline phosphatase [Marivirga harenae]
MNSEKTMKNLILLAPICLLITACNPVQKQGDGANSKQDSPNVILMIGDGMGMSQLSSVYYFKEGEVNISRFKHTGFSRTSSATQKITDSGAAGTAMANGVKTYNGAIGVDVDTNKVENLVKIVSRRNYSTGIIATSTLTHATPASFFAHSDARGKEDAMAAQMHNSEVDFFAAGGLKHFNKRNDGVNYLDSLMAFGFTVDTSALITKDEISADKKYGFLLQNGAMPKKIDGRDEFLPNATSLAIEYFKKIESPFFLMVEGSQIDWGGHDNHHEYLVGEMNDFDDAIGVALDFAEKEGNTTVVVTADHETGGYTLRSGKNEKGHTDYNVINPSFSTGGHSAAMVPVLAYGPNAEVFTGIYENTEIFQKILNLTK